MSDNIYKLRKELNLTQDEFGTLLSVSRQAVSKWELGQSTPDLETIKKIKQLFNVSYDSLLDEEQFNGNNNDLIIELRRKRQYFYYSITFVVLATSILLYYATIRLNGYYDGFMFNEQLRSVTSQLSFSWFYMFIRFGLLILVGLFFLLSASFLYFSLRKSS